MALPFSNWLKAGHGRPKGPLLIGREETKMEGKTKCKEVLGNLGTDRLVWIAVSRKGKGPLYAKEPLTREKAIRACGELAFDSLSSDGEGKLFLRCHEDGEARLDLEEALAH